MDNSSVQRKTYRGIVTALYFLSTFVIQTIAPSESFWADWWSYDGISGPDYWGLLNSEWRLCSKGKYQSPVNINPKVLVFDPSLAPVQVDRKKVSVTVINTGHDLSVRLMEDDPVFLHGGPLAYKYRIYEVKIHFGSEASKGSEHTVGSKAFPVEIQFLAFNEDLYSNISAAVRSPHGLAALAVFAQSNDTAKGEFSAIAKVAKKVRFKGDEQLLKTLPLHRLLPSTKLYMTYEGSITFPPCHEVVTWIIMNRPITITKKQLTILRALNQGDRDALQVRMENNFRKTVPLSNRTIRTNIQYKNKKDDGCAKVKQTNYAVNERFTH
ncbi:carbonic anhydrase-related protein 10-like isoform X2 [Liolophura sinensis]|uniref:carbonic anhydrase-related protein 10-like isoform X2 n=1 Tax=Liolophura sinensis TaxID=3198878 RepID=UPI00315802D8